MKILALVCTSPGIQFRNRFFFFLFLKLRRAEIVAFGGVQKESELCLSEPFQPAGRPPRQQSLHCRPAPPAGLLPLPPLLALPSRHRLRQRPQVSKNKYHPESSGSSELPWLCGRDERSIESPEDDSHRKLRPLPSHHAAPPPLGANGGEVSGSVKFGELIL